MNEELQKALISKDVNAVKMFKCDEKFLVDQLLKNSWSLVKVAQIDDPNLTKLFLESVDAIDVNSADSSAGYTALHQAVHNFDVDHVKLLLDHNANPNILTSSSRTPLNYLYADYESYKISKSNDDKALEILKMLIDRGADAVTARRNSDKLQIEYTLMNGNPEAVEAILNTGVDLRAQYDDGDTAVHYLAQNKHPKAFAMLGNRDFNVDARNDLQETPLLLATLYGAPDAVDFLLGKGADVNAVDDDNCTPIYMATHCCKVGNKRKDYVECIMLLLQHGADIQVAEFNIIQVRGDEVLGKIMLEHVALQEALEGAIPELIRSKIDSDGKFKEYFGVCKRLLNNKIYESHTLFSILACDDEKMIPYIHNEELVRACDSRSDELKAIDPSYYSHLLQTRLAKARETAKLRDSAAVVIGKLMDMDYDCHSGIIDLIISYLSHQDLNTLLSLRL